MSPLKVNKFLVGIVIVLQIGLYSCTTADDFTLNTEASTIEDIVNIKIIDNELGGALVSTDMVKDKWESQFFEEEGIRIQFNKFQIIKSVNQELKEDVYFLKAISKNSTVETGAFLIKVDEGVYRLGAKQCSCEGCPTGCKLVVEGDNCSCSSCDGPNRSCTKKETIIIDPGN